ncbi:hypothetical protein, partial [Vibrio vulnificus]|uniref:hypothetical protein n=1 Tax=Vibrio vulnificus TaxID=672 RepID=UPI000DBBD18F
GAFNHSAISPWAEIIGGTVVDVKWKKFNRLICRRFMFCLLCFCALGLFFIQSVLSKRKIKKGRKAL